MSKVRSRVVIVQMYINNYRVPFYRALKEELDKAEIELVLLTGKPSTAEAKKQDHGVTGWEIRIPCVYFFRERLCWLPAGNHTRDADLVIVPQENKLVYNLWLLFGRRPHRIAFWGHGRNMQQSGSDGLKDRFKRWLACRVDWWFAYTNLSAGLVAGLGFPAERITVVDNAVDTTAMMRLCRQVSEEERKRFRELHDLGHGPVGLYLGSLQKMKRLDFMLEAASRIHDRNPDFRFVVAGAGPDEQQVIDAVRENYWMRYLGPVGGQTKATLLTTADIWLNPGTIGLGLLDSFASGLPCFTTNCGTHSPEIAYLNSGVNGVMTADTLDAYVNAVCSALQAPGELVRLGKGAQNSARQYTVENMASRFSAGIVQCLSHPPDLSRQAPQAHRA